MNLKKSTREQVMELLSRATKRASHLEAEVISEALLFLAHRCEEPDLTDVALVAMALAVGCGEWDV